ncbi:MAG: glycosyltransferase family 87 protein [Corynebacterium sp.]|nr:glycosyltransferase family 87 protein [Corynebacterium sp.]
MLKKVSPYFLYILGVVLFIYSAFVVIRSSIVDGHLDYEIYWATGKDVLAGNPLYDGIRNYKANPDFNYGFVYPPLAAFLFALFALMPYNLSLIVWTIFNLILLVILMTIAVKVATGSDFRPATWFKALGLTGFMLLTEPASNQFTLGQISVILAVLIYVDIFCLPQRYKGILLGIAAAIKVTPFFFMLFFLIKKDWWSILRCGLSFVFFNVIFMLYSASEVIYYWTEGLGAAGGSRPGWRFNESAQGLITSLWPDIPDLQLKALSGIILLLTVAIIFFAHKHNSLVELFYFAVAGLLLGSPLSAPNHWLPLFGIVALLCAPRAHILGRFSGLLFFLAGVWQFYANRAYEYPNGTANFFEMGFAPSVGNFAVGWAGVIIFILLGTKIILTHLRAVRA